MTSTGSTVNGPRMPGLLAGRDVIAATAIWLVMTAVFWFGSHGTSLRVTFVPGVAVAYLLTLWLWRTGRPLPSGPVALPLFFVALAVQFTHFAEENATDFATRFPLRYGGDPYDPALFVTFNMVSYATFTIAAVGLWCFGQRRLIVPVLFFCVYGTYGNACAHLWWTVRSGQYFPGLYTSLIYWVLGPLLLHQFLGRKSVTTAFALSYPAMTVALLTTFEAPSPLGP